MGRSYPGTRVNNIFQDLSKNIHRILKNVVVLKNRQQLFQDLSKNTRVFVEEYSSTNPEKCCFENNWGTRTVNESAAFRYPGSTGPRVTT
jgi:hypothetical protein